MKRTSVRNMSSHGPRYRTCLARSLSLSLLGVTWWPSSPARPAFPSPAADADDAANPRLTWRATSRSEASEPERRVASGRPSGRVAAGGSQRRCLAMCSTEGGHPRASVKSTGEVAVEAAVATRDPMNDAVRASRRPIGNARRDMGAPSSPPHQRRGSGGAQTVHLHTSTFELYDVFIYATVSCTSTSRYLYVKNFMTRVTVRECVTHRWRRRCAPRCTHAAPRYTLGRSSE